jgi:hypothetical protein
MKDYKRSFPFSPIAIEPFQHHHPLPLRFVLLFFWVLFFCVFVTDFSLSLNLLIMQSGHATIARICLLLTFYLPITD